MQQAQLWQALQEAPRDGGLWNGAKVVDFAQHFWVGKNKRIVLAIAQAGTRVSKW